MLHPVQPEGKILLPGGTLRAVARNRNYGKKSYHKAYRLRRVTISSQAPAGALAAKAVGATAIVNAATEMYRLISVDASFSLSDLGAAIDDGFAFGFSHSDYSNTEVEECLEAVGSIDRGDKIAMEQANRLVRYVGTIAPGGAVAGGGAQFNDGKRVKTRLNWLMTTGDQLMLWQRNASGVVWTTGSNITVAGDLWVKDGA